MKITDKNYKMHKSVKRLNLTKAQRRLFIEADVYAKETTMDMKTLVASLTGHDFRIKTKLENAQNLAKNQGKRKKAEVEELIEEIVE